jgi:hypothetical protein
MPVPEPKAVPASEPPLEPGAESDTLASAAPVDADDPDEPEPVLDPAVEPEDVPELDVVPVLVGTVVVPEEPGIPASSAGVVSPLVAPELGGAEPPLPEQAIGPIGPRRVNKGIHERRCCPMAIVGPRLAKRASAPPTDSAVYHTSRRDARVIQRLCQISFVL